MKRVNLKREMGKQRERRTECAVKTDEVSMEKRRYVWRKNEKKHRRNTEKRQGAQRTKEKSGD